MKPAPRLFFVLLACSALISCNLGSSKTDQVAISGDETGIRDVLAKQEKAWNDGNIEEFMKGYWNSDSLQFVGSKITRGWQSTLERYKATYPDRATMGSLKFEFYRFSFITPQSCLVTGRYTLTREQDQPTGLFTLLLKNISGKWVIVYDHTS